MYYGENSTSLDDKGRLMVPLQFRQVMEVHDHDAWFMTRGFDGAIFMFEKAQWEALLGQTQGGSPLDPRLLDFRRLLVGSVAKVKRDGQGRILVPSHLREYAGITSDAVMIGVGDHLELWSKENWRAFQQRQMADYKQMATQLFGTTPGAGEETGGNGHVAH